MTAPLRFPRLIAARYVVLLGAALVACRLVGAGKPEGHSDPAEPRVDGGTLVLPPESPSLGSVRAVSVAAPSSVTSLRINGRLVWDEDRTVRVFTPIAGRITKVLIDAGQRVEQGQALALIASPDYGQAQADARRATADLTLAVRTLARQRDLLAHGIVPRRDVEAAEADSVRALVEQQRAEARLALYGGDSASLVQGSSLRTPLGGLVVERNIGPGQEVRPDQMLANAPQLVAPLFVVTDPSRLWVQLDVPERDLPGLAPGRPMSIRVLAWPDREFQGRITLIGNAIDPTTRTVKVRGAVENPRFDLKSEMLVAVDVTFPAARGVEVPAAAVFLDGDQHLVFVEERRGRYRRTRVTVGAERDGKVSVVAGLRPTERVVADGAILLNQLFRSLGPVGPQKAGAGPDAP